MEVGPHVFGDNRLGLWVIDNAGLTDKLRHVLPRLKKALPVTDVFLPETGTLFQRSLVREAGFFTSVYAIPHGRSAFELADAAVLARARMNAGSIELNIEIPDDQIRNYVTQAVARVRHLKPLVPLRINIAPFKGKFLPATVIEADPNLYVIEQAYFGNMDGRASESDCHLDLVENGIPEDKASVMFGVLNGNPRINSLPAMHIRRPRRGSVFSDDLLLEAGLLP